MLNSVSVSVDDLAAALAALAPFAPRKASLPLLHNVHLSVDPGTLTLRATDLDAAARYRIPARWSAIDDDGKAWAKGPDEAADLLTVNLRDLAAAIKGAPKGEAVRLTVRLSDREPGPPTNRVDGWISVHLPTGGSVQLCGIKCADFPCWPTFDALAGGVTSSPSHVLTLPADDFASIVGQVAPFVASDDARPILTGIAVDVDHESGTLTAAASDGFRLSYYRGAARFILTPPDHWPAGRPTVLHGRTLEHVAKVARKGGGPVSIIRGLWHGLHRAQIATGPLCVSVPVLDGNPPDYTAIIPRSTRATVRMTGADLFAAVKAAAPAAKLLANVTRFAPSLGAAPFLTVSAGAVAAAADDGPAIETPVRLSDHSGDLAPFALNNRYVLDYLSAVGGAKAGPVTIAQGETGRGPIMLAADAAPNLTHLIMPMMTER